MMKRMSHEKSIREIPIFREAEGILPLRYFVKNVLIFFPVIFLNMTDIQGKPA